MAPNVSKHLLAVHMVIPGNGQGRRWLDCVAVVASPASRASANIWRVWQCPKPAEAGLRANPVPEWGRRIFASTAIAPGLFRTDLPRHAGSIPTGPCAKVEERLPLRRVESLLNAEWRLVPGFGGPALRDGQTMSPEWRRYPLPERNERLIHSAFITRGLRSGVIGLWAWTIPHRTGLLDERSDPIDGSRTVSTNPPARPNLTGPHDWRRTGHRACKQFQGGQSNPTYLLEPGEQRYCAAQEATRQNCYRSAHNWLSANTR